MKKVLLASTALVGFAGAAAAQGVEVSGSAEMGIFGGTGLESQFFSDWDVTFTMTGETDNGLTFGASIDLDEGGAGSAAVGNNSDDGGATVFISGSFGTLTMGDTDGALDWALTDAGNNGNPGSIADDETTHAGYLGAYGDGSYDGQILRYDYSFGDFAFAVSVEMDDDVVLSTSNTTSVFIPGDGIVADNGYAVGLRYALDLGGNSVNLGLGYQSVDLIQGAGGDVDIWGVSAAGSFGGGFSAGIEYTSFDPTGAPNIDHIGIGVGFESGPVAVHANYGNFDMTGGDVSGFGFAAAYDLGGGASINLGYGSSDLPVAGADFDTWSLGVAMAF